MFCTRCGSPIPDGMKFCTQCGAPAAGGGSDQTAPAPGLEGADAPTGAPTQPAAPMDETTQLPQPVPASDPSATAPSFTQLPPTVPQDDIAFQPPRRSRRGVKIALIALGCVVLIALVGVGVWFALTNFAPSSTVQVEEDDAVTQDDGSDATDVSVRLDLEISSLDTSSYPQVSIDIDASGAEDGVLDALTAADFNITETTPDGGSTEPAASRVTVSDAGDALRLVYTSELANDITRTVKITLDEMSGASGSVSASFTAPGDAGDQDNTSSAADDYVLPDSDTRRYTASELDGYSDWELYLARNEIYARHGRMFQNADLQSYFDGKDWYVPRYSPEDFDANVTLSETEIANAETIRSVEEERGSSYL